MKRIDQNSWIAMHPYAEITHVDSVYILIANEIYLTVDNCLKNIAHIDDLEIEWISCCLTAYLEDRVSGINIFRSFNKLHYQLYDKVMPFYRLDSRYDQEGINSCDINFIVWNCLQQIQIMNKGARLISPYNSKIVNLTSKIYSYFRKIVNRKEADVNFNLRSYYYTTYIHSSDQIIEKIYKLKTRSYLLATYDDYLRFKNDPSLSVSGFSEEIDSPVMLGLNAHQWYAQMLGFYKKEYMALVEDLEILPFDSYLIKSDLNGVQQFESVNTHRQIAINLANYIDINKLSKDVYYLHSALIRFKNNWELVAPVQITRKPTSSFCSKSVSGEDPDIYMIPNKDCKLNYLPKGQNVKCFESFDELISFFDDVNIVENLHLKFGEQKNDNYILYTKCENSILVIKSIAPFINQNENSLYNADFVNQQLASFIENASTEMKKIIFNLIINRVIVDLNGFENKENKDVFEDNIPFISIFLMQHICNDKS